MSNAIPEPKVRPTRFSRFSRDTMIRVAAILGERDDELMVHLRLEGFRIETADAASLEKVANAMAAEVVIADADVEGTIPAIARLRRCEGVLSTVPVVLISAVGGALRTSLDAVESGGDVFAPRPVEPTDLAVRLRALLEIPGIDHSPASPSLAPPGIPPRRRSSRPPRPPSVPPAIADAAPAPVQAAPPTTERTQSTAGGLSPGLADVLRSAAIRAGGSESDLVLPSLDDEAIDELIPPELLEPLDAPLDSLADDSQHSSPHTPPPFQHGGAGARDRRTSSRSMPSINPRSPATPTITPLALGGELRLAGPIGALGVGAVLGAACRARASGLIIVRSSGVEHSLSITSGHLLAIRSSRSDDDIGSLLVRLGAIPREAARFAAAPLDAGLRGAAMVASRGYLGAELLAQALGRAARELTFDLLTVNEGEWEMRPLETAVEIPLAPRSLDALLILGARARIEPEDARDALGGPDVTVSLRADAAALTPMPLTRPEREAAVAARGIALKSLIDTYGIEVVPSLLALAWLAAIRVDGANAPALLAPAPVGALAQERTRLRALVEAAEARDVFALLGVSEWSTRRAAIDGLEARRAELTGLRSRHPDAARLADVQTALDELGGMLTDSASWARYVAAVRARSV